MRKLLLSAIALGAMTSLAWAEPPAAQADKAGPVELTDVQMDAVTAAGFEVKFNKNFATIGQTAISYNTAHTAAVGQCKLCAVGNKVWQSSAATNVATINQNSPGF